MSRCRWWAIWFGMTLLVATAAPADPAFVIRRATIVAFFPPMSQTELERDPGMNETLEDFQLYAMRVREPLAKIGVDFKQVYARSFRVTNAGKTRTFRPDPLVVGYYFAAPGKTPRIEYGVATDADLVEKARKYFGVDSK